MRIAGFVDVVGAVPTIWDTLTPAAFSWLMNVWSLNPSEKNHLAVHKARLVHTVGR